MYAEGICEKYMRKIRNEPFLAPDEEFILAKKWRDKQDQQALSRLVSSHLKLVVKVANGYKGYGLPMDDLVAEGHIGILQATKHFDPDKGFKFATYAQWWIKATIQEHILHSWSLVKIGTTVAQKKLFFNLRKIKNKLDRETETSFLSQDKINNISTTLNVKPQEVLDMHQRMMGQDSSLNAPLTVGDSDSSEWIEWVSDEKESQETSVLEKDERDKQDEILDKALKRLKPREQHILHSRRMLDEPMTLEDLSIELNISRERVRQIEASSFEKLRKYIIAHMSESNIHF